ncbi:MAG: carbon monoxide dehydrogenase subunit G [Rhodospirillales bacterium]|nr:MAG: carbon monoxide dehydrogenase subunit G [Rhodospirillales bacterium]
MQMSGEYRIPAPRQAVWDALNDVEVLKQCIPGCEELVRNGEHAFDAKVVAKVGPVRAKFGGAVELSDIDPPNGYTISGQGQGGAAGFAKGGATVKLAEDGADTVLSYTVDATVGGKLAQIGSRLIDATAKKFADDFFSRFADLVGGPAEEVAAAPAPAAEEAKGLPAYLWVGGLVAIVIIILLVFAYA